MSIMNIIIVYSLSWWVILFIALPIGVKTPDNPETGHASSAPEKPRIWMKIIAATFIAAIITVFYFYFLEY